MVLELLGGGAIGIASSFVASKVFLSYTNSKLPQLNLSDCLITESKGSQKYLVVKILNKTPHPILDMKVFLYGVNFQNEDHSISNLVEISKNEVHSIREYCPSNKERPDAIWLGLKVNDNIMDDLREYEVLRLEVTVRESFYNTFLSIDKSFTHKNIHSGYIFEKGDDLTCRKINI